MTYYPMPPYSLPSPKPSDTANYSGVLPPDPTQVGTIQTGGWADNDTAPWGIGVEVLEGLPANCRVQVTGTGVTQVGPNQYKVQIHLGGMPVTLVPNAADANQAPTTATAPNTFVWTFVSRNKNVATVDSDGVVTAVGYGETEILVMSPRNVNSGVTVSDGVQASVIVQVLP